MNRIEIVGLFTALERLCDKKDLEGIEGIVKAVLNEAKTKDEGQNIKNQN